MTNDIAVTRSNDSGLLGATYTGRIRDTAQAARLSAGLVLGANPRNGKVPMDSATYQLRFQNRRSAEKYARRFDTGTRRRASNREIAVVRETVNSLPLVESILDVPCGAGRLTPALTHAGRRVTGLDISEQLLAIARERHGRQASFRQADVMDLPLSDASVDCVFCNRLLHHLNSSEERIRVLRELRRVARLHLVVSFFDYHRMAWLRRIFHRMKNGGGRGNSAHPTATQFQQELRACGWEPLTKRRVGRWWGSQHFVVARTAG